VRVATLHVPGVRSFAALLVFVSSGCAEPPADPLDPAEIQDVAKDEGDARGSDRSGTYLIKVDQVPDCDCPMVNNTDLCGNELTTLATRGGVVLVTQTDGYLVVSEDQGLLSLSGALAKGGEFDVAGVYGFATVLGEIGIYLRLDGSFTAEDRFTGSLQSRALGDYEMESIDCRNEVPVTGTRIAAP
jgi:hypothetical protein